MSSPLSSGVLYDKDQAKQSTAEIGWVFMCDGRTQEECLERKLFGAPKRDWRRVSQIKKGDTLFLLNYETSWLYGVFEAVTDGMMNLDGDAFGGYFPAQVRVATRMKAPPASKGALLPLIKKGWIRVSKRGILLFPYRLGPKFVNALWRVFLELPAVPDLKVIQTGRRALDGDATVSYGERQVDNWLHEHLPFKHIYRYSVRRDETSISCDWYIPDIDLYVEYWENSFQGRMSMPSKHEFYKTHSLNMIDLHEDELHALDQVIPKRVRNLVPKCRFRNLSRRSS